MGQLESKVAIVTGSDSGIGRAIALQFAQEGAAVVINYPFAKGQGQAQQVVETIQKNNGKAIAIQADVSQNQQITGLIQQTVEQLGRLDILVNNAGIEHHNAFVDVTEQQFDLVLSVDLKGAFFCAQAAAREMVKSKTAGRIINISSVHEDIAMPNNSPYCCAKGGVRMLTRTICNELAPFGITVNNIAPGAIFTPIDANVEASPKEQAALFAEIPLHRWGQPEEIAKLAVFLASDAAAYVTGATYVMDGGLSVHAGAL
jgi:glucose 1-dehydrogenase